MFLCPRDCSPAHQALPHVPHNASLLPFLPCLCTLVTGGCPTYRKVEVCRLSSPSGPDLPCTACTTNVCGRAERRGKAEPGGARSTTSTRTARPLRPHCRANICHCRAVGSGWGDGAAARGHVHGRGGALGWTLGWARLGPAGAVVVSMPTACTAAPGTLVRTCADPDLGRLAVSLPPWTRGRPSSTVDR